MLDYLRAYVRVALSRVTEEERGQTAVEYGLVILLVALVLTTALALGMGGVMDDIVAAIKSAVASAV